MEETISQEKKKVGPSNYTFDKLNLKGKTKGNYLLKSLRTDYFDQIKFFAGLTPASNKYNDGKAVSSPLTSLIAHQKPASSRHLDPRYEALPLEPPHGGDKERAQAWPIGLQNIGGNE